MTTRRMTGMDEAYCYRDDLPALQAWMLAQWKSWLARGGDGFRLALAVAMAPPGPEGDAAQAQWTAAVIAKDMEIRARTGEMIRRLAVRPGKVGEPGRSGGGSAGV